MSLILRKPLLLAFTLGCAVSALASGRFSVRLIADGALSFWFVPALEIAAFAIVFRSGRRPMPFARAWDLFSAGNWPWLLWLVALAAVGCLVQPKRIDDWITPAVSTAMLPFALSAFRDFRFFRDVLERSASGAFVNLMIFRAVGWSIGVAYFLGIAIWSTVLPPVLAWFGR